MPTILKNYTRYIKPQSQVDTSYMSALPVFDCEITARFVDAQINNGEKNMALKD